MNRPQLSTMGLKHNPFAPSVPNGALYVSPEIESFCWRVVQLAREGGFALLTGLPGTGKSAALRILQDRLGEVPELRVGVLSRPQSNVADFYREMGELFGVHLSPHNRWAGSKVLRERWEEHIQSALFRPVLLIDEAQEMLSAVLEELRLLGSAKLDSRQLLTVVLAGDQRLPERFRTDALLPLGSRIRVRLTLGPHDTDVLRGLLAHAIEQAGNPALMSCPLQDTLCDHAAGNYRSLMSMADELLATAVQKELGQLDEKLYFDVFGGAQSTPLGRKPAKGRRR